MTSSCHIHSLAKHILGCKYSSQNVFNAINFYPHKKTIPLLNLASAPRVYSEPDGQSRVLQLPLEPIGNKVSNAVCSTQHLINSPENSLLVIQCYHNKKMLWLCILARMFIYTSFYIVISFCVSKNVIAQSITMCVHFIHVVLKLYDLNRLRNISLTPKTNTNQLNKMALYRQWTWFQQANSDRVVNTPSQWEATLHGNVVSHWLGACTKWSPNQ